MLKNNSVYISSLQAADIVRSITASDNDKALDNPKEFRYTYKFNDDIIELDKYKGSLSYSLDLIELDKRYPDSIKDLKRKSGKSIQITRDIIDVSFDYPLREIIDQPSYKYQSAKGRKKEKVIEYKKSFGQIIFTEARLREILYHTGFWIGDIKYVLYKRSSSKSREGKALFINSDMYDEMILWSRMGIVINDGDECNDLPSLKAYESLSLSGLENTIIINPEEILFIDDVEHSFYTDASVSRLVNGELVTQDESICRTNSIWDGQALLDESIFDQYEFAKGRSMMLLRNRFFKSCAFNTRLQEFFSEHIKQTGKTTTVDLTGAVKDLRNIKMVTTPSSLKLFKFVPAHFESRAECLKHWATNASNVFGVCKSEKPSFFDGAQVLSYQMINSMPFTKADIQELMQYEIDYIDKLNNNYAVFKHHIGIGTPNLSRELIYNLMSVNDDVQYTELYKDFRRHTVDHYKTKLKKGKILIPNTDYAVLFGNPYEMLLCAIGKQIEDTIHHGKEVYCKMYADGEELIGFRNPHICAGNVLIAKNIYHPNLRWFNLTDNIIAINSYDNDIYDRLQGADLDSDTVLMSNFPVLLRVGKECMKFKTPINLIDTQKVKYTYSQQSHADIDNAIADNFIGRIINLSQMLNSFYWDLAYQADGNIEWYNFEDNKAVLDEIYNKISLLSSLSQLELDKAKKFFEFGKDKNGNDVTMLDKIENIIKHDYGSDLFKKKKIRVEQNKLIPLQAQSVKELLNQKGDGEQEKEHIRAKISEIVSVSKMKQVKPMFFKFNSLDEECSFEWYNTPMDFVCKAVDSIKKASKTGKSKSIGDLLVTVDHDSNRHQIPVLIGMCEELEVVKSSQFQKGISNTERLRRKSEYTDSKEVTVEKISKLTIRLATVISIINRCYDTKRKSKQDDEIRQYKLLLLKLLYKAKPELVKDCFKANSLSHYSKLVKCPEGNINIFGNRYREERFYRNSTSVDNLDEVGS